jgi:hypothetical protein
LEVLMMKPLLEALDSLGRARVLAPRPVGIPWLAVVVAGALAAAGWFL